MVFVGGQVTAEDVTTIVMMARETGATKALNLGINKNEQDKKMLKKLLDICRKAIQHYGWETENRQACEEMGELIAALHQYRRGKISHEDVVSEIADVLVTTTELALIFGKDKVAQEVNRKLDRLQDRIKRNVNL